MADKAPMARDDRPSPPPIRRAAVLGAGTMGRTIAAQLANCGLQVELLDLEPADAPNAVRAMLKQKPAPYMLPEFAGRIRPGNFDEHLERVAGCDWVVEAIVERADIKQQLFAKVVEHLGPNAVLSSNTSGISIAELAGSLPEAVRPRFLGTHFFNPPRYLYLLELIPGPDTDPQLLAGMREFGEATLGKGCVVAKDRPNFIANRIGTYGILRTTQLMQEHGLSVEEVDFLTGPLMGRPKSASFRTCDIVGLDVLLHVAKNVVDGAPDDPQVDVFEPNDLMQRMVENERFGDKTGEGFYKVVRGDDGKKQILSLDPDTLEYSAQGKPDFPELADLRKIPDTGERLRRIFETEGKGAKFCQQLLLDTLHYSAQVSPEIAHDLASVDRGLRWGFAWELGPFQVWDALGFDDTAKRMGDRELPGWISGHLDRGAEGLYDDSGNTLALDGDSYTPAPRRSRVWDLQSPPTGVSKLEGNDSATLYDLGENVLGLELHGKMNTMGAEAIELGLKAQCMAEGDWAGLVVTARGDHFSAGANLAELLGAIGKKDFDSVDQMVRRFQLFTVGMARLTRPVVVAPFGMALGGGCELSLHAHRLVAHAELYTGLVELGVGLIPAGGGTKELYRRMLARQVDGPVIADAVKATFGAIGMAKVSNSAHQAKQMGILRDADTIAPNRDRLVAAARDQVVALASAGFAPEPAPPGIPVGGEETRALVEVSLYNLVGGRYASEHDRTLGRHLANILSGGEQQVRPGQATEQQLLDLEREAFLSLCGEEKTVARIEAMLKTGKPLRN